MVLTAEQRRARCAAYQARWRAKRAALVHPEVAERALMQAAERCERLSVPERTVLADKLADAAMGHLRRSQALARIAQRVRLGEDVGER